MASGKLIFIREKQTCRFIDRRGLWVIPSDEAAHFNSVMEAADFCFKYCNRAAEIVLRMGKPMYDVKIDVNCSFEAVLEC